MRRVGTIVLLSLIVAACAPATQPRGGPSPLPPPYDLVISGGRVVDGTGAPWFYGELAIRGDRIARVAPAGLLRDAPARERLDARGMVVGPGFIDIQGQSGGSFLFGDGRDVSKVTQGITTEILGEGGTPAPANDRTVGDLSRLPPQRRPPPRRAGHHARRGAPRHGGRRLGRRLRVDLSARELRGHGRADRDGACHGALRRRLHHAHAVRGRSVARSH